MVGAKILRLLDNTLRPRKSPIPDVILILHIERYRDNGYVKNEDRQYSVRVQAQHSSILTTDIYTLHNIGQDNPIIQKFDTVF